MGYLATAEKIRNEIETIINCVFFMYLSVQIEE